MIRREASDEHAWFRESVAEFVRRELKPAAAEIRESRRIGEALWRRAGAAGFLGLGIDERDGGTGVHDFRFNAILGEELARVGMAYASSFTIHTDVVAPYLRELTTEEQRRRWLPGFCSGERVTGIAMSEPGAGSDLAAITTRARPDGDAWVLSGAKSFITNGISGHLFVVAARTDPARRPGITLFAVEQGMPGFTRGRKLEKVGQHEADTAELFFEEVRIPPENVLGEVNQGFAHMMERLPQERLGAAISNLAHAQEAFDQTLGYVRERHAFGRPIGTFQNSRFLLAEMATKLDVTRAFLDRCLDAHVDGELTPEDAAKAKLWSSEVQNRVVDACVQLHGGYGYMMEYDVARAWADARVTRIWAGTNEIMKEIVGRSLGLGEPVAEGRRDR